MENKFLVKKCLKCGAMVKVIDDCNCSCGFECCGEKMEDLIPNSVDASFEKHIPTYEVKGEKIIVKVNHVMEEEHFIKWISLVTNDKELTKYFKPGEEPICEFPYIKSSTIYSYCNKHDLWKTDVE